MISNVISKRKMCKVIIKNDICSDVGIECKACPFYIGCRGVGDKGNAKSAQKWLDEHPKKNKEARRKFAQYFIDKEENRIGINMSNVEITGRHKALFYRITMPPPSQEELYKVRETPLSIEEMEEATAKIMQYGEESTWIPKVGDIVACWDFNSDSFVPFVSAIGEIHKVDNIYIYGVNILEWYHVALIESLDEIGKHISYFKERGKWV